MAGARGCSSWIVWRRPDRRRSCVPASTRAGPELGEAAFPRRFFASSTRLLGKPRAMGQRASKPAPRTSVEAAEPTIIILSGGTGRTADELTRAALAQFSNVEVRIVRRTHVRTQNVVR